MMRKPAIFFSIAIIGVLLVIMGVRYLMPRDPFETPGKNAVADALMADDNGFAKVYEPKPFEFPADHGAHADYRTEWWYFTGNLQDASGRAFGYQLTFFRFALAAQDMPSQSVWRNRQVYMAHFTVTDVEGNMFYHDERFSRAGLSLAGAETGSFRVWLNDWSAEGSGAETFPIKLTAKNSEVAIALQLTPDKPMVLQGNQGLSQKSAQPGNASYYYSYTRLATVGQITIKNQPFRVSGVSWMDREWSTSALSADQAGWDWFSLQLSDRSEIMFYRLRRKDGAMDPNSAGTLVQTDHAQLKLNAQQVKLEALAQWTSPHSKRTYPARWRLAIPEQQIVLNIAPLLNDQELNGRYRYWEGAVKITGEKDGYPVTGRGYVELTGY